MLGFLINSFKVAINHQLNVLICAVLRSLRVILLLLLPLRFKLLSCLLLELLLLLESGFASSEKNNPSAVNSEVILAGGLFPVRAILRVQIIALIFPQFGI